MLVCSHYPDTFQCKHNNIEALAVFKKSHYKDVYVNITQSVSYSQCHHNVIILKNNLEIVLITQHKVLIMKT